jgi:radical SAM superfamily enzyme YgiQ (UPF0313 family)
MHKRKLLLINPARDERRGFLMNHFSKIPPINLAIIAALTPSHWEVKISDENFSRHIIEEADLVGLTAYTSNAPRAYEIAALYKLMGVKTIMGGIHASMLTEEASRFVDTIVSGEAETLWAGIITDFEKGQLKSFYKADMEKIVRQPMPRHDLLHPDYLFGSVQTTRGCPFDCDFCTVSSFNGKHFRSRPLDDVLSELHAIDRQFLLFVDDNLVGYSKESYERAIELFSRMKEQKIKKDWMAQVSMNVADDPRVLKAAAKCGCRNLFIGFETDDNNQLKGMDKKLNFKRGVKKYDEVVKRVHKHGISVLGAFMFGNPGDTKESMRRRVDYIVNSSIDISQLSVLTPMPGTRLFRKMADQNCIVKTTYPDDWKHYDALRSVVDSPDLTASEMDAFMEEIFVKAYNRSTVRWKFIRSLLNTRSFTTAYWAYVSNYNYYRMTLESRIMGGDPDFVFWKKNNRL